MIKVLFDHPNPFAFAHGGFQTQIEQTKRGLEACGVEVEWMRWWDSATTGAVIHYFGRPSPWYVDAAHRAGMKVVIGELLTGLGSRGALARRVQAGLIAVLRRSKFFDRMGWNAFRRADACVALTLWEARLMTEIFGAPAERVHVVPNGVEDEFFAAPAVERGPWLVCTATITERKRVLELARAAVTAQTPVWIIGKPYSEDDPYWRAFADFQAGHRDLVRYEGAIADRAALAQIYRAARGFVLLSTMESLSLSALEASACECPLLLSDLPWAMSTFAGHATYCPDSSDIATLARPLRSFWEADHRSRLPFVPLRWVEVAERFRALYGSLRDSR